MLKNKVIKRLCIITYIFFVIQIVLLFNVNMVVTANSEADDLFSNITGKVNAWEGMGENQMNKIGIDTGSLLKPVLSIAQAFTFIGFVAVIISILIIAVKWQYSGKNPEVGEKVRKQTTGLAIAAAILFGANTIWSALLQGLDKMA